MRVFPLVVLAVLVFTCRLGAEEPSREALEFFEGKIRPLLVDKCFKCHSGPKVKAHLALASRAGALKGGDTGPALVPGAPGQSLLMKAIGYEDPELRMPPSGKLSGQQIDDVAAWIKMGAPWSSGSRASSVAIKEFNLNERKAHWSLLPLTFHSPPLVKNRAWVQSPIDAFVLAALEQKGLAPARPADKRALLRRVTFDLIGLPPTPEEIDAFLNDPSPDAFTRVVDRLLASPHYGERWARHWLDLVRYAETLGHEFDIDIPDAWRYRDYVIRAFNDDVPYDQFVLEHLAGDLLAEPRRHSVDRTNESILGTGFWFLGEAKHSPVDVRGDQADRIDNQIDVFGKTFLGMTLACARCHDHKFDAISTKDYYALAGYLQSSRQQRASIDDPAPRLDKIGRARAVYAHASQLAVAESAAYLMSQKEWPLAPLRGLLGDKLDPEQFTAARQAALERLREQKTKAAEALSRAIVYADARSQGFADWLATGEAFADRSGCATVSLDFTTPLTAARVDLANRARSDMLPSLGGALRSPTFIITKNKIHFRAWGKDIRVNLIVDGFQLIRDPIYGGLTFVVNTASPARPSPEAWRPSFASLLAPGNEAPMRWHTMDVSMWMGHRAYIEIVDEGPGQVIFDRIIFSDSAPPPPDAPNDLYVALLSDPANATPAQLTESYVRLATTIVGQWAAGHIYEKEDARERIDFLNALLAAARAEAQHGTFHAMNEELWRKLDKDYAAIGLPLPAAARALAITDGTPVDENVFIRGNHKNLGTVVPRRFLEVFGGADAAPPRQGSGRLELARQVLDPARTPIVPRVVVNRLWKHHFGEGIVRSPDDFGVLGQTPTHPELLDFLAAEFVKSGWSIKKMHRLMLLSSVYQMDSHAPAAADEADPDNKLLHKMPVRRLEAEAIRDAMLAVSGRLDQTLYGPSVPPYLTPFMAGRGRPSMHGPLDGNGRRSIYLGVRRNFLNPTFLAFDYPTPFSTMGKRGASNVPAQALTMMNNPLVLQEAELWAKRTIAGEKPRDRVGRMYVAALGRPPSAQELADVMAFLDEQERIHGRPDDSRAWADLGHALFNLKEFIFVN